MYLLQTLDIKRAAPYFWKHLRNVFVIAETADIRHQQNCWPAYKEVVSEKGAGIWWLALFDRYMGCYKGERYLLRGLMKRRNEQTAAIDDKARTHNHTEKQSHRLIIKTHWLLLKRNRKEKTQRYKHGQTGLVDRSTLLICILDFSIQIQKT